MPLDTEVKTQTIVDYRAHEKDTGSPDVQVAILTQRIRQLTEHLNANRHDQSSRRGLQVMVGRRRRLLKYISRIDLARYKDLIARLGLRR
ncbi:MAG TPA: 30S ribosomal protein S15 [Chloroflexota bacterium]|nr:30S ribosomal protein S15 [Chloroflexota bacterium]